MVLGSIREGSLAPVCASFFVGIVSASLAWYWAVGARCRGGGGGSNSNNNYEDYYAPAEEDGDGGDDGGDDAAEDVKQQQRPSYLRWVSSSMEDIKNRIGELPSRQQRRRKHWPWDQQKNRSRSSSPTGRRDEEQQPKPEGEEKEDDGEEGQEKPTNVPHESKSEFCIGSIFGLDVGGTLAKLVYFEQKPEECDSEFPRPTFRERFYRSRASALAVSLARRGLTPIEDDDESENSISPPRFRSESTCDERLYKSSSHLAPNGAGSPSNRHHHRMRKRSADSSADLRNLNNMRQESVPDDLNFYAESVHLNEKRGGGFHTTESMEDMLSAAAESEKQHQQLNNNNRMRSSRNGVIRKSRSMFDFAQGRIEALDRFYSFAHRLDSYREGVKDHELSFFSRALGGDFHFIRFETRRMQNAMDLIRANNLHLNIREMGATGGGAHKYAQKWAHELGIEMKKQDELDSLVAGMQFVIGECYTFRPNDGSYSRSSSFSDYAVGAPIDEDSLFDEADGTSPALSSDRGKGDDWWWSRKVQRDSVSYSETYPYTLVTIGTGVSILRVDGPRKHERVSGSTIGGGTYWGLIRLLTNVEDFEEAMRLAERGDASKVDMMVGDIYGDKNTVLEKIGLSPDVVASSFGKLVSKEDPASDLKEEDLARALLLMVTINIGQVAYLNAKMHKTSRIYFVGNFLRFNKISQRRLSFSIDYWSKGEMEALFLEHEGYFGALGAFLLDQDIKPNTPELRLKTQKSMPASVSSEEGSNNSSSDHGNSHHRLLTQKSMPVPATSDDSKHYPRLDRRGSN